MLVSLSLTPSFSFFFLFFSPHLSPNVSFHLRPLQPGSISRRHLWPEAAGSAASWSHPDPEAAGGGGRLRRLQHRTQRPQLLPACMFTHTHSHWISLGSVFFHTLGNRIIINTGRITNKKTDARLTIHMKIRHNKFMSVLTLFSIKGCGQI